MTKFLPFLFFSVVLPIDAATITFQEGVNGYLHLAQDFRGSGATNNGTQTLVGYQTSPGVLEIRTVMAFALSEIPAGST
ncbi:hypothetical protein NPN14_24195, partial [Vibrio parahaemolyticus]|uniref:hypothetical protein n=1 Tax=Vibrio parahaemolyticus TaxID=670 RepID=UPI0021129215